MIFQSFFLIDKLTAQDNVAVPFFIDPNRAKQTS